jgi:hypothetical protein
MYACAKYIHRVVARAVVDEMNTETRDSPSFRFQRPETIQAQLGCTVVHDDDANARIQDPSHARKRRLVGGPRQLQVRGEQLGQANHVGSGQHGFMTSRHVDNANAIGQGTPAKLRIDTAQLRWTIVMRA